jgi:hypothetical protein
VVFPVLWTRVSRGTNDLLARRVVGVPTVVYHRPPTVAWTRESLPCAQAPGNRPPDRIAPPLPRHRQAWHGRPPRLSSGNKRPSPCVVQKGSFRWLVPVGLSGEHLPTTKRHIACVPRRSGSPEAVPVTSWCCKKKIAEELFSI